LTTYCQDILAFSEQDCEDVLELLIDCSEINPGGGPGGGSPIGGNPGGGSSGTNTGNNGGHGGGGSGSSNSGSGPSNFDPYAWLTPGSIGYYAAIFQLGVPINIFVEKVGGLPEGLTPALLLKLKQIADACQLTPEQVTWLGSHPYFIEAIQNELVEQDFDTILIAALRDVLDARIATPAVQEIGWPKMLKLWELQTILQSDIDRIIWLVNNSPRINKISDFVNEHSQTANHRNLAKSISIGYIDMLASGEPEVNEMINDIENLAVGDPMWDFLIEQIAELLEDALIDIIPGGTLVTLGPEAIEQFNNGDFLGGLWTSATIVLDEAGTFIPVAKVVSLGISLGEKAAKLGKFYDVMKRVYTLGDDVAYKVYHVLRNKLDKLYSKIEWTGNGAKIAGGEDPLEFWDDFVNIFGATVLPTPPPPAPQDEIRATFGSGQFEMRFYPSSTSSGQPTIVIKKGGYEFKMRF
jgi:hypothetical protein